VRIDKGWIALFAVLTVLALSCATHPARADDSTNGTSSPDGAWTLAPVTEAFTVQTWGGSCGPAPTSDTLFPGAQVTVKSEGSELVITGGAHTIRTDQCLDPLPTLSRTSHSGDGHSWRTSCSTSATDPRHASVNAAYFLAANNSSMTVAETGRYEFTINGTKCIADVSRSGSLSRVTAPVATAPTVAQAPPPAVTQAPTAPAPDKPDCRSPGDPARLEIWPSKKLLKLGDTFAFHAAVRDAEGCPTGTAIQWAVGTVAFKDGQTHSGQPAVDGTGKLAVPGAEFGDATFDVIATAAGKSARASVEVTTPANYEALLAQSGLDSNGERDEPAVAVLATTAIGGGGAKADDGAAKRRMVFIGVVVTLAVLLGVVALVGVSRAKRARAAEEAAEQRHAERMQEYEKTKREREEKHAVQMKKYLESIAIAQQQAAAQVSRGIDTGPMFCLSCRREVPAGNSFCPFDANRLVTVRGHSELMSGPQGGVCPTCRKGYNPGVKTCPKDGDELVPAASVPPSADAPQGVRGKICPTCGNRADGAHAFCGKDGTQLVMLN
jgi:hypothetical protein